MLTKNVSLSKKIQNKSFFIEKRMVKMSDFNLNFQIDV